MAFTDWWMRGQPALVLDSTITSSQLGSGSVGSSALAADAVAPEDVSPNVWAFIPGEASIVQSSKSSDNEWYVTVQLRDADGTAYPRVMPVRVYLGTTAAAGSAVASTSFGSFLVATSANVAMTSGTAFTSTLAGIVTTTHLANVDYDFLTDSSGYLTLCCELATDAASTDVLHVVWAGGAYRASSSQIIGSSSVTTA
ncbi:MAG: hypothetical protein PHR30_16420 [Gallionellaceae bacterium]|nr:hypothetical protein [Gallionellaceae bacterium]